MLRTSVVALSIHHPLLHVLLIIVPVKSAAVIEMQAKEHLASPLIAELSSALASQGFGLHMAIIKPRALAEMMTPGNESVGRS